LPRFLFNCQRASRFRGMCEPTALLPPTSGSHTTTPAVHQNHGIDPVRAPLAISLFLGGECILAGYPG